MGCHFLLQGIFPTQGLNPGLPHCRQTLYHLSHQGSPNVCGQQLPSPARTHHCRKVGRFVKKSENSGYLGEISELFKLATNLRNFLNPQDCEPNKIHLQVRFRLQTLSPPGVDDPYVSSRFLSPVHSSPTTPSITHCGHDKLSQGVSLLTFHTVCLWKPNQNMPEQAGYTSPITSRWAGVDTAMVLTESIRDVGVLLCIF